MQKNNHIHIEDILEPFYEIWIENQVANKEIRPYIEIYFFLALGFGYLTVLCKNLNFSKFKIEYDRLFKFLDEKHINYKRNKLLTLKEIRREDKMNRICKKIFLQLHRLHLGKIILYMCNKLTK